MIIKLTAEQRLVQMLGEVSRHVSPQKEATLFSLGGRGYYENPVSDLLAFFFAPKEQHGLGSVFLDAFLRCIRDGAEVISPRDRVQIAREETTGNGKRIDLAIRGMGWMILIENKIHHVQNNPFDDYEEYFTAENGGKPPLMVVLSPQETCFADKWQPVSYRNFCRELTAGLESLDTNDSSSKWRIFAKELVLHLQNELYHPPMETTSVEFVEENWKEIAHAKQLLEEYRKYLLARLKELLESTTGTSDATTKDDHWAIRCRCPQWGQTNIAWWYCSKQPDKIGLTVYVLNPTEDHRKLAKEKFESAGMEARPEGPWIGWRATDLFGSREEAEEEFKRLSSVVNQMFPATPLPVVTGTINFSDVPPVSI